VIHFTPSLPSLELASKVVESDFPGPAKISFWITSGAPVSWEAKIEYPDDISGATITPSTGIISDLYEEHSFELTAKQPGSYSLTITIKDEQSRFAATEVKVFLTKNEE